MYGKKQGYAWCEVFFVWLVYKAYGREHLDKVLYGLEYSAVGVTVDGKCGKDTDTAIRKYQKIHGLTVDGVVGLNTWKVILGIK